MGYRSTGIAQVMTLTPRRLQDHIMHPSGGLVWHWRALRNRQHWQPLQQALRQWLNAWQSALPADCNKLILIGPSAGWTLPLDILRRFDSVVVFEPDIFARSLLRIRFYPKPLHFDSIDLFSPGGLEYLGERYADHALLFCNVLGQLSPDDPMEAKQWCLSLRKDLRDCQWASYHDWASTVACPSNQSMAMKSRHFPANSSLEYVLNCFWHDAEIEICDHFTESLSFDFPFDCIPWRLRKNQWHLVQWTHQLQP